VGRVITVFSAPNYCGRYGNRAAYLSIENGFLTPWRFDPAPNQPEPVAFDSVSAQVSSSIAQTCPYMPTTLQGFVSRALELWSASSMATAAVLQEFSTSEETGSKDPRSSRLAYHETRESTRDSLPDEDEPAVPAVGMSPFVMAKKKLARAFKGILSTNRFQTAKYR